MTIWTPDLQALEGPLYLSITEALARDVGNGRLVPGTRLPTHRALARELGITVGTVSRAYDEARRRGLVAGEVGRGTFVRGREERRLTTFPPPAAAGALDLSLNAPGLEVVSGFLTRALSDLARDRTPSQLFPYLDEARTSEHAAAGALWVGSPGFSPPAEEIVVTSGAQHAMLVAIAALCEPGDVLLAEELTFSGIKTLARFLHLRLEAVAMDAHGVDPEALEEACRRHRPKAMYCMPDLQNPTARQMSASRRDEVVAIADRHRLTLVEDRTYAFLLDDSPATSLAARNPDGVLMIDSLSKSLAPGLRVGYLRAPKRWMPTLRAGVMTTTIMPSSLTTALATELIRSGDARKMVALRRHEARFRRQLAGSILGEARLPHSAPESEHVWLTLPAPWRTEDFCAEAAGLGVALSPAGLFAVGRAAAPHAVRISLSGVPQRSELERGLRIVAEILDRDAPASFDL